MVGDNPLLLIIGTPTTENMYLLDRTSSDSWEVVSAETENEELVSEFINNLNEWSDIEFSKLPMARGWYLAYRTTVIVVLMAPEAVVVAGVAEATGIGAELELAALEPISSALLLGEAGFSGGVGLGSFLGFELKEPMAPGCP